MKTSKDGKFRIIFIVLSINTVLFCAGCHFGDSCAFGEKAGQINGSEDVREVLKFLRELPSDRESAMVTSMVSTMALMM